MIVYVHGSGHLAEITRAYVRARFVVPDTKNIADADVVWCCEDVETSGDVNNILSDIQALTYLSNALFLISSQIPAGSMAKLDKFSPKTHFAYCPENFKQTDGPDAFLNQYRYVIGVRHEEDQRVLTHLFPHNPFIIWMSIESAEMVKHTVNAYLGMCIEFINEIRDICEVVGADIKEVERGLLSERRVSPNAPLRAGEPFGGGHIDRDLSYLQSILSTPLITAIQYGNAKGWVKRAEGLK